MTIMLGFLLFKSKHSVQSTSMSQTLLNGYFFNNNLPSIFDQLREAGIPGDKVDQEVYNSAFQLATVDSEG